ncbi:GNAT family N-acetyltransferase [Geminicoccus roseus]|uniref:GNAT family N-acetyltransferase n=1 Tax=Geminicoccus roseus TaxID=404900 RepID=UPI0004100163|nr:GNAT family N-acetyltransferase [Geminicoccus roseus]
MRSHVVEFLDGYLNARGNAGSELVLQDDFALVRYRVPMGRRAELFYWGSGRRALPLEPGMWLTVLGEKAAASLPPLPATMSLLVEETLMEADLPLQARTAGDAGVTEIQGPDAAASFNEAGLFALIPAEEADRNQARFFQADWQGEPAAASRYGRSGTDLVVVDQVLTLPAHRRRGLAETLMAAMADRAARNGASRMMLISSQQGRRLYERVGFRVLAPVLVYQDDGTPGGG